MAKSRWSHHSPQRTPTRFATFPSRPDFTHYRRYHRRTLLSVLGGLLFIYLTAFSPLLRIRNVRTEGSMAVSAISVATAVAEIASLPRWRVLPGNQLLFFDTTALRIRLMKNPRLADVHISRRPLGTIRVLVEERVVAAFWKSPHRWYELDETGKIIAEATPPSGTSRIILTNATTLNDPTVGEQATPAAAVSIARWLHDELSPSVGLTIASYDVARLADGTLTAVAAQGLLVHFNTGTDTAVQVRKLRTFVLEKTQANPNWQKGLRYIDLRFGDTRIYYK